MNRPATSPTTHRPRFLWQALLIVLPVLALTLVGLLSLRQDRALAEQDARGLAERIAQEAADQASLVLFELDPATRPGLELARGVRVARPAFEITAQLALVSPPALEPLPTPVFRDPAGLAPELMVKRDQARLATQAGDPAAAVSAWTQFLADRPPPVWAADAEFQLADATARAGNIPLAQERFLAVAQNHPGALGESGLPLAPLARWRAAELDLAAATNADPRSPLVQVVASNLVCQPTSLTPLLLDRLDSMAANPANPASAEPADAVGAWRRQWQRDELSRALFSAAVERWQEMNLISDSATKGPVLLDSYAVSPLWVGVAGSPAEAPFAPVCPQPAWLLTRFPPSPLILRFYAWTECEITELAAEVRRRVPGVPAYFTLTLSIGGRRLPAAPAGALLAERAAAGASQPGVREPKLAASVFLTDPTALYARQRQRTWWFVALVLTAAATAGVGLAAAYRAFQRQLRLSEMKSNFVSSVSHELRAPIASVRLLAESLDRGTITDEAKRRDYFRLIGQECRRLSALIENVLDFSRIDQGRKQYEFEPTDLGALAAQTVRLMEPYASERQVTLHLTQPSSFNLQPCVDGKALQQALVNLIDNAVKHSPAGAGVQVTLAALETPADEEPRARRSPRTIRLAVTDQGPGIPAGECERIFEPFHRLGSELRRETPGVGIGLSIVRHIVTAHGGRVFVEHSDSRGSRFVIELPADPAPPEATP